MLHAETHQEKKNRRGGRAQKFPITLRKAADALGVNNSHLYRVLVGERDSRSLMRRYQELLKSEGLR